nr:radical SAM protein [Candidatus Halobonum tyrrellensis]
MRLESQWEAEDEFKRAYFLEDETGTVLEEFSDYPTLDQLRNAEQRNKERINLSNLGIPCANCSTEIRGRFAADPRGNLLCWECAVTSDAEKEAGIRVNTDPTQATISESHLYEKSLCDYVVNVATGCRHGCKFCYVPTTPGYEGRAEMLSEQADVDELQEEWGSYLLYRDDLPERLHEELQQTTREDLRDTERGQGVVMLSSGTDPYQDRRAGQITRGVIHELLFRDIPVRVLTRSSIVVKDVDLFKDAGDLITVGSSIPSFNEELVGALEPGAPPPLTRWEALDMLQLEGVPVYVSMSPTYPTMDEHGLHRLLTRFMALRAQVVFHEPINPRGENFGLMITALEEAGLEEQADEFRKLKDVEEWVKYALKQLNWVQQKAEDLGAPPIHSWPDRELVRATSGKLRDQLAAMRQSPSPEQFEETDDPTHSEAHRPLFEDYEQIDHLVEPDVIR